MTGFFHYSTALLVVLTLIQGCSDSGGNKGGEAVVATTSGTAPDGSSTAQERLDAFNLVMESSCALSGCHVQTSIGDFSALLTDADWAASRFVSAGDPDGSSIYNKLKSAGGNMPPGDATLTAEQAATVYNYVLYLEVADTSTATETTQSSASSTQSDFQRFTSLMQNYCLGCHSSAVNGNFAVLTSEADWQNSRYVTPGNATLSTVYTRLKNAGGDMPQGSTTLPDADASFIQTYINGMTAGTTLFLGVAPRIGTRSFVESVLTNVFGSNLTFSSNNILDNVHQQIAAFSGPCDLHGSAAVRDQDPEFSDTWCFFDRNGNKANVIGDTNSVRHGWLINVCEQITSQSAPLVYALETSMGFPSTYPNPSASNLESAYQLFYPGRSIPTGLASALLEVSANESDAFEKWRWTFLALCLSAEWQVP